MFDNYVALYIYKRKRKTKLQSKKKKQITNRYGLKSASKPSGKSMITLICVPCDISPKIEKNK